MTQLDPKDLKVLLILGRQAMGKSQRELGETLGVAMRTVQRWEDRGPSLLDSQWHTIAKAVHPHDAKLAARIAGAGNSTLEKLGLVQPPAPPPEASPPPAPPPLHVPHLVDSVLYAAMQDDEAPDVDLRPMLVRAFRRAAALRLDPNDVADALEGTWKAAEPRSPTKSIKK